MEEQIKRIVKEALDEFFANKPEKHTAVMNIKELAKYINKSVSWIRQHREQIPKPISPKPLTWHKDDIDEWLEMQRKPIESGKIITANFDVNIRKAK